MNRKNNGIIMMIPM